MVNGPRILDSPLARHLKILSPLVAPVKFLKEPHYGLTRFPERSHRRSHERRYRGGRSYREFERQLEARRLAEDDPETLRALRRGWCLGGEDFRFGVPPLGEWHVVKEWRQIFLPDSARVKYDTSVVLGIWESVWGLCPGRDRGQAPFG